MGHAAARVGAEWDAGHLGCGELILELRLRLNLVKVGGTTLVCSPCFKKRKLDEGNLVAGATIGGGAKLVELLSTALPA